MLKFTREDLTHIFNYRQMTSSNQNIRTFGYRNRPLGILTHREAGDLKYRGFLLNAAGIRKGKTGVFNQLNEVYITQRLNKQDVFQAVELLVQAVRGNHLSRARVDGIDDFLREDQVSTACSVGGHSI